MWIWLCIVLVHIVGGFSPALYSELKSAVVDWNADATSARAIYGNIGTWDTSRITSMYNLFGGFGLFSESIGTWNTSSVITMERMFFQAHNFNHPIGSWNTARVTNMRQMFYKAQRFSQSIESWETARVADMKSMFEGANQFCTDISSWGSAPGYSQATASLSLDHNACSTSSPRALVSCDDTPAPTSDNPGATCGGRVRWLVNQQGYNQSAAVCSVQKDLPVVCGCLPCCHGTPAPTPDNLGATCGGRVGWLVNQQGYSQAAAVCSVKNDLPVVCSCLHCCDGIHAPAPGNPNATCGRRVWWLVNYQGYTQSAAVCQVKKEEPVVCGCLQCSCETHCNNCTSNTTCTECKDSRYLFNNDCLGACPAGYYGSGSGTIGRTCQACETNCNLCTSSTACTECNNSRYLLNHDCLSACPVGYHDSGSGTIGRTCQACETSCNLCTSSIACTECKNSRYLLNHDCLGACPAGYHGSGSGAIGRTCQACQTHCNRCTSSITCTECKASKYLFNNDCLSACPVGYHGSGSGTIGRTCQACETSCNLCTSSTACTECKNSRYLLNHDCLGACPAGYSSSGSGTIGRTCQACKTNCNHCTSSTTCTECKDARYLFNHDCLGACPAGYHGSGSGAIGRTCQACQTHCNGCTSSITCTECMDSKYLLNNDCLNACPAGYYGSGSGTIGRTCQACETNCNLCTSSTACTECKDSTYLLNHDCVGACPTGYLSSGSGTIGRTCQACETNCNVCTSSTTCTECKDSKYLFSNDCLGACPAGSYGSGSGAIGRTCQACETSCNACTSSTACTECKDSRYLFNNDCLTACPTGYSSSGSGTIGRACQACQTHCNVCTAGTSCTECKDSRYLFSNACLVACPAGYYGSGIGIIARTCQACKAHCNVCIASKTCTQCKDSKYLFDKDCLSACPAGYYGSGVGNIGRTCQPCQPHCNVCTTGVTCAKCQDSRYLFTNDCLSACPAGYHGSGSGAIGRTCQVIVQSPTTSTSSAATTSTNITEVVLEGSMSITVANASWLASQSNFSMALKRAIGNMSMVAENDVYIVGISLLYSRRLTDFALDDIDQPIARFLLPLTATTASGLRIDFEVKLSPDGKTHVTASTISKSFNSKSIAEASEVINTFLSTNMFGHPLNVKVSQKFIKIKKSTPPAPSPSPSSSRGAIFIAIISAAIAAICCFALPIKCYIKWKQTITNGIDKSAHATVPIGSYLQLHNKSAAQLMCAPIVITREYGYAIRQFVSNMLDPNARDAAHVAISFSPGTRDQDVEFSGPGVFHAAAIIKALQELDIRCCISECWLADNACDNILPSKGVPYKIMVVLESCALYKCGICLEQIHAAFSNGVQILRLKTDASLPFVDERWPQHREATPEVEDLILQLNAIPSWSEQPITSWPDGVDSLAHDVRVRLQLCEWKAKEDEAFLAFDNPRPLAKEDSAWLPVSSKAHSQESMNVSVVTSLYQAIRSGSRRVKQLLEPRSQDILLQVSTDGTRIEALNSTMQFSKSKCAGQAKTPKKAHARKNATQGSKNGRKAAAVGGDEDVLSKHCRSTRKSTLNSSVPSKDTPGEQCSLKGSTNKVHSRGKDGSRKDRRPSQADPCSGDIGSSRESAHFRAVARGNQAKNGPDAVSVGKDGGGTGQMINDARKSPKPGRKEDGNTPEAKPRSPTTLPLVKRPHEVVAGGGNEVSNRRGSNHNKSPNASPHHKRLSTRLEKGCTAKSANGTLTPSLGGEKPQNSSSSSRPEKAHSTQSRRSPLSPRSPRSPSPRPEKAHNQHGSKSPISRPRAHSSRPFGSPEKALSVRSSPRHLKQDNPKRRHSNQVDAQSRAHNLMLPNSEMAHSHTHQADTQLRAVNLMMPSSEIAHGLRDVSDAFEKPLNMRPLSLRPEQALIGMSNPKPIQSNHGRLSPMPESEQLHSAALLNPRFDAALIGIATSQVAWNASKSNPTPSQPQWPSQQGLILNSKTE